MSRISRLHPVLLIAICLCLAALPASAQRQGSSSTLTVSAGYDMFITPPDGYSFFYIAGLADETIPEGFFGCVRVGGDCLPSDAIAYPVRVLFEGLATGSLGLEPGTMDNSPCKDVSDDTKFGRHCADGVGHFSSTNPMPFDEEEEDIDTIVLRGNDMTFDAIGDVRSTTIELVSLSLESIKPITVTYGNGRITQRFDVIARGPLVPGQKGKMVVSRTGSNNGTYFSRLPISVAIAFENTDRQGPGPKETLDLDLDFVSAEVPWEVRN
ncbi:MAG: hypothetical protein AAF604_19790 [Acidobacteriota bacterium]